MSDYVETTFWVQVEPEWSHRTTEDGSPILKGAKAKPSITQTRPRGGQRAGTIMAPITMRIPKAAFLPLSPKIVVTIPENMISTRPIEIEATDGTDGEDRPDAE